MTPSGGWWKRTSAIVATVAWAADAAAHGVPTAITGVAAAGPDGPSVALVSDGLVQRSGGEWYYVCPSQFGTELAPPALSSDGARTFVIGESDLFVLGPDGDVTPQHAPELSRRFVVGLGIAQRQLFAFRFDQGGTDIRSVSPMSTAPLWRSDQIYDSLSADDAGFWAARTSGTVGRATRLDLGGAPSAEHSFSIEPGEMVSRVAAVQGSVYVSLLTPFGTGKLLRLGSDGGAATLLEPNEPLIGPVSLDVGAALVIADGALEALAPGPIPPTYTDRVTCLGRTGNLPYVCSRTRLFTLAASGPTDLLLDLADLKGPRMDRVTADSADRCALEWRVFQRDLRAISAFPPADAGTPQPGRDDASPLAASDSGCTLRPATHGAPTSRVAMIAVTLIAVLARLTRRAGSTARTTAPSVSRSA